MNRTLCVLRKRSLGARVGLLCGVVATFAVAVAAVGGWIWGGVGVAAACTAGAICLLGAVAALWATEMLSSQNILMGMLVGMAVRMGLPLGLSLALYLHGGPLSDAGLLYFVLAFYPVTLTVETILSLPDGARQSAPSQTS